ncbi:hypothetical protein DMA15_30185 [Streptomyces sp. WAC 01529]|nr:hypothetical protein DMA15_30185 [Streptomyces sp. WAC 01529]
MITSTMPLDFFGSYAVQRLPSSAPQMLRQQGVVDGLPGGRPMGWRTEGCSGSSRSILAVGASGGGASPPGNARSLDEHGRCGAVSVPGKSVDGFDQHGERVTAHFSDETSGEYC